MKGTIEIQEPEVKQTPQLQQPTVPDFALEHLMMGAAQIRPVFSDSLLRYAGQRRRQTWATFASFTMQCLSIVGLILLPLYFTQELPKAQLLTFLMAPPPPSPAPPPVAQQAAKVMKQIQSDLFSGGQLRTPTRIPERVQMIKEEDAPPPMPGVGGVVGGVPGGIPGGQLGGVIGGIVSSTSMVNDDLVKCPLCGGYTYIDRPELLVALHDPKIRQQVETYGAKLLGSPAGELAACHRGPSAEPGL